MPYLHAPRNPDALRKSGVCALLRKNIGRRHRIKLNAAYDYKNITVVVLIRTKKAFEQIAVFACGVMG
jgi:hypothetical protein